MGFTQSFKQDANITAQTNLIDMSLDTGAVIVPKGTTAQRPANPKNGTIRYNTTIPQFEVFIGTSWKSLP
jgi:hypothetical protein